MNLTDADIFAYVIALAAFGGVAVALGVFLNGRIDGLIDDPKLPERLSDDEREYRRRQLATGVLTLYIAGSVLLLAAVSLYIWST